MSEPRDETASRAASATKADGLPEERLGDQPADSIVDVSPPVAREDVPDQGLSRRGWTVLLSGLLVVVFGITGMFVQVPYVAIGPGPTFDTLGEISGKPVIQIDGQQTYPTTGELRMTTVSLNDNVSLFGALGLWVSGRYALAPREDYFKPGESDEEVQKENVQQFKDSQSNAEVAALKHLGFPTKVLIKEIVTDSPAAKVLSAGDKLLSINGKQIIGEDDVKAALVGTKPGQAIPLTFQREGEPARTETITLGQSQDRAEGFIGFQPIDRADVPFDIKIQLQDIGGPSAGLVFAVTIVDRLTPGELIAGKHIAGTGEINEKGEVGPIGGISFKLVAAHEAGATAFLTPAANCAEAAASVPAGLKLIKVTTLDSALTALDDLKADRPTPSC